MTHGLQLLRSGIQVAGDIGAEKPLKKARKIIIPKTYQCKHKIAH